MVRAFGDDLLRVIAEVGMVFHPTVSPSVSLVIGDGLALPIITSRGQWLGQGMCYDAMLVASNHALYSAGVKIPQGQQDFDVVHGEYHNAGGEG